MRLILVRHGDAFAGFDGVVAGRRGCTGLTPLGREQAMALRDHLAETRRILARDIATPIRPLGRFWRAETYHQDYYEKNPVQYRFYRWRCGRDQRVREVWGDR